MLLVLLFCFFGAARAWKWGPLLLFGPLLLLLFCFFGAARAWNWGPLLLLLLFCFFGTAAGLSSRPSSYLAEF